MNFGALIGGAAQGAQAGRQMKASQQYADAYSKNSALADEKQGWERDARNKADAGVDKVAERAEQAILQTPSMSTGQAPVQGQSPNGFGNNLPPIRNAAVGEAAPVEGGRLGQFWGGLTNRIGLANGGIVPIPDAVFQGQPEAAYSGGLARPQPQAPAEQPQGPSQQQQQSLSPSDRLSKALMNGNALNDPDTLNDMMTIAEAHGIGDKIKPYLTRYYEAKKSGVLDGAKMLMNGQIDDAIPALAKGGIKLEDRPRKASDDPNDNKWILNISGTGEQTLDVADMYTRTVDFGKYLDHKLAQRKQADVEKGTVSDRDYKNRMASAQEKETESNIKVNDARIKGGFGSEGGLARNRVEKMDAVMKHRDNAIDDLSSVKDPETGKFEVDPQRRQLFSGYAADAQDALESYLGKQLTVQQHYKLNNLLRTAPPDGNPVQLAEWSTNVMKSFGVPVEERQPPAGEPLKAPEIGQAPQASPAAPAAARQQSPEELARPYYGQKGVYDEMLGIQKALRSPGLSTAQRAHLALQAQRLSKQFKEQAS